MYTHIMYMAGYLFVWCCPRQECRRPALVFDVNTTCIRGRDKITM